MDDRRRYDTLILYEKVFVVMFLPIFLIRIYLQGGMQLANYVDYQINKSQYNVVEAQIVGVKEYPLYFITGAVLAEVVQMKIMYEMDEINFINNIYFYADKEIGNHIDIAVNKNNPNKVRCCILSDEICDKIYDNFIWLITFFIVFECVFLINKLILKKIIKKSDNNSMKRIDEEKEIRARFVEKEIEKKQKVILTYCGNLCEDNLLIDKITEVIAKYNININNEYIWCLTNLSLEKMSDYNLLPLEGKVSVVSETVQLRESGLPCEYYVIAKVENNYLCGKSDLQRVYCFSHSLGITNTPYATIYDYIIEQIGNAEWIKDSCRL